MSQHKTLLGWHFLPEDRRLRYGTRELVEAGRTYTAEGPLALCENGMHASVRAIDALRYALGPVVCRVRLAGEMLKGDDKVVGRSRTVLWMFDASMLLHTFAVQCATDALEAASAQGREPDPRSYAALDVKLRWLHGEATDVELSAAQSAAQSAAESARNTVLETMLTTWEREHA